MTDVFVGFVFDDEKEKELMCFSKCGVGTAANQYQQGILSGLSGEMRILTTLSTGAFPRLNRKLFFKKESKTIYGHEHTYLPFVNLFLIRDMMFRRGLYRELSKVVESQQHTKVYVYSLYMPSLKALEKLKKKYGNRVHYCLIIPDLAGKYGLIRRGIKGIKDRLDAQKKMSLANRADSFVFLTEAMKELFDPKPYTVIEGFLPACEFDYSNQRVPKSVLYTGSLNRAFGMQTLLEAFSLIQDPDAQLWICGVGDLEDVVKEAAKRDRRIQYMGFLPKSEIAALQTQCDVLINPRPPQGEYTKYSFPSKTMEYLLSGSKVVMHQLPGIGEEYYRFIRVIEDTDAEAMARAIVSACEDKTFYDGRWQEQIRWMLAEKNSKNQLKNIWSNCHED